MRLVGVVAAAAALTLSAPAGSSIDYSTVAKARAARGEPDGAFLALGRARAARFSPRLRPADRRRVASVDFRRYAAVAAFVTLPTPCNPYGVASIVRRGRTLVVTVAVPRFRGPCILPLTPSYHAVKVARGSLGTPLPRRAVLRVTGPS